LFDELDKSVDTYLLQEHWLFDCQLHLLQELHHNYNGTGKAVDTYDPIAPYLMPRGHGGVAIMWKKTMDNFITPLTVGNERIQCVELSGKKNVILISVYLPCKGSDNHLTKLKECIDLLHEIMETYKNSHQIVIGGDFNENIINGTNSQRRQYITDFMSDHRLATDNVGLTYFHPSGHASSAIDYILYQEQYSQEKTKIQKLKVIANVSDHSPILLSYKFANIRNKNI